MSRQRLSPAARDVAILAAERAAYAHYGLEPTTRSVAVDTGFGSVDVRVTEFGASNPGVPIVLLHGIASISVLGAPLIAALEGRRVLAVDWPGHGLSGPCVLPAGVGLRSHAVRVVEAVLAGLDVAEADLVGHSLGAQFSLYAALDLPERVRRMVLLGAPGAAFIGVKPVPAMKLLAVPGLGKAVLSVPMSERMFTRNNDQMLGVGAMDHLSADLDRAGYLLAGRTSNAASIASYFRALIKWGKVRRGVGLPAEELARVRQRVLLVWGDCDVFLAPALAATSIVALRDARLIRLAAAGHAPWLQEEAAANRAIVEHLA